MVITVNKKNSAYFKGLAPDDFIDFLDNPNCFIFGAVTDYTGAEGACGGLLITELVREWLGEGDEYEYGFYIRWLYVAEVVRNKGVANELMDAFYKVINESGQDIDGIVCEIPGDDKYNLLCNYLVDCGYSMEYAFNGDLFLTRDDIISNRTLLKTKKLAKPVTPIDKLPKNEISFLLDRIDQSGPGFFGASRDIVEDRIHKYLSCVIRGDDGIRAAAIWIQRPSGLCEMVRVWSKDVDLSEEDARSLLGYIVSCVVMMVDNTEGFLFHFDYSETFSDILDEYINDLRPELIRRSTYDRGFTDIIDLARLADAEPEEETSETIDSAQPEDDIPDEEV